MNGPTRLRVEHLLDPLGIDVEAPRLSWQLPAGTARQLAYAVETGSWESGRVESAQSVLVPYRGPSLVSGERVEWRVKAWTDAGESDWSAPAFWEMGLLEAADWVAGWIEPPPDSRTTPRPAQLFRGSFEHGRDVERARMYVTAHGIYELFVNGARVGDLELTPGWTSYRSHLQVQTFDVLPLLRPGENVVGAIVSDGWYAGQIGTFRRPRVYGEQVGLLAQLNLHRADGAIERFGTGPGWVVATGEITEADLMQGQVTDFRRARRGWCRPGADLGGWNPVVPAGPADAVPLVSSPAPPVRKVAQLRPVSITKPSPDRQIVDLGQNINGWLRLERLGPADTELTLTYGEALDGNGDVTQANIDAARQQERLDELSGRASNLSGPFQVDRVISAGRPSDVFEPRHTTHGFRYVRVEGHRHDLSAGDVTGFEVNTDLRRVGWFECSDARLNRLHEAARWSFIGNACDVPTDCPTRERAGWTGDWQIFLPTAAFLYDVAGFSTKWLRDLAAEQEPSGAVQHVAPMNLPAIDAIPPGTAGWGDAAVIVPWELYRTYGDVRILEEQWESMVAWVEYAARSARSGRHPSRIESRPEPASHEPFLWDAGVHFGEWLEPGEDPYGDPTFLERLLHGDKADIATAYLHLSARLLARIATILERQAEAARYADLAEAARAAWQTEFVRRDGTLTAETQANYVRALAFDLVREEHRRRCAERLVDLVRAADTHLATGFLATPYLLPVLADNGYLDVAYELLLQETEPSWLLMIDRGATTIWEAWNGIAADGTAYKSLNHYSKGAVVSFLHQHVAGIRMCDDAIAYERFRIAPRPGGGLAFARAAHESPYGLIESSWRADGDAFTLRVVVPPGTSAEVRLPDGRRSDAGPGTHEFRSDRLTSLRG